MELVLLILLLAAAVFLTGTVLFQKSKDEGLSSTIVGGTETFYGKDKKVQADRKLRRITLIVGIVFIVAVLVVYFAQPDYTVTTGAGGWTELSSFSNYFKKS